MLTTTLPTQDHAISLSEAAEMTSRYRENLSTILQSNYSSNGTLPLSETFNIDAFEVFMNNPGCKAIRIYYGMDSNLKVHAILVGVNENNEDILPTSSINDNEDDLREDSQRCPPSCPPASPLNDE